MLVIFKSQRSIHDSLIKTAWF